ncbi:MAG: LysM peptidoglycan-binding domain-containing protein [Caldilineaceae bacterium]|nr:LysM peptidoglycan-binding domain-containing protein [Caldilineaceae bacterium]
MSQIRRGVRALSLTLVFMLTLAALLAPVAAEAAGSPAAAEAPQENYGCSAYHYVHHGQTLSQIAEQYGASVYALMSANNIGNPNHIYAGMKLCIPGGGGYHDGGDWGGSCSSYHYVRYGQTLSNIAEYYGVSVEAMMQANRLYNPNHIYVGQKLCVPGGGQPVSPPPQDGCTYHLVKPQETLSNIALYYGVSVHYLMGLNGIANPNHIYAGQWLKISCDTAPPYPCGYNPCTPPPNPCPTACTPPTPAPTPMPTPVPTATPAPPTCYEPCRPQPPTCDPCGPAQGGVWTGQYYSNKNLEGDPVFTRNDAEVNFNWMGGSPGDGIGNDGFSARWTRSAYFETGHYGFVATSDDGVRVYVDGVKVIDSWSVHPATQYTQKAYVHGGYHTVVVEYFEDAGDASIHVRWDRY